MEIIVKLMTEVYDIVLEIVAENPGITLEEFVEVAADQGISSGAEDFLSRAVEREDVLEFDGRYWVVRKDRFAFTEYDHPET